MGSDRFIQKGAAASLPMRCSGPPQEFRFLLLPKATMLAMAAAIEPLRIANQVAGAELYRWYTMTEDGRPVTCSNGVTVTPDMALEPLPAEAVGFVCGGVEPLHAAGAATLNWLRREDRFGRRLGGICTGAFALAQAGLLDGHDFTLHWENQPGFSEAFPGLEPSSGQYEISGRYMTCGGGSASTDMMLAVIEERHGENLAIVVADMCLHTRTGRRGAPQKSSFAVAIGSRNPRLLAALHLMQEAIEEPLSIVDLCARLGISRRQLERLFQRYLRQSPKQVYHQMLLTHAYALLSETSMTVTEIALASGFTSATHFSRQFKARYGASPHFFRKTWA